MKQIQQRPELHERVIEPAHSKEKLMINDTKNQTKGDNMHLEEESKKEVFEVSKQEHDILRHIYDLMETIDPQYLGIVQDIPYGSHCDGCKIQSKYLLDAHEKATFSFKLILQQILISNDLCHLSYLAEKYDELVLMGFTFSEGIHAEGRFWQIEVDFY